MGKTFTNWNKSNKCRPSRIKTPKTEDEIRGIVQHACKKQKRIRVVGRGVHTYGSISMCDDNDIIVNLQRFNKVLKINKKDKTVNAQAGIALEDLLPLIEKNNVRLALRNMGEITEQCLGGVTATGTHGSGGGGRNGVADSFSDQVISYKIMELTPQARVFVIQKGDADFNAFMTHLGYLAIILEVKLQLVDWYHLEWKARDIGDYQHLTADLMAARQKKVYSASFSYFPSTDQVVEIDRDLTDKTFESGIQSDIKDEFVTSLRQGGSILFKCCPCCSKPYADVQKKALLTLKGSDTWRKVLSQGDLWGGTNLTLITDLEYALPLGDKAVAAFKVIRKVLQTEFAKVLSIVGVRFVKGTSALMACHYSEDPNSQVFAFINVQLRTKKPDEQVVRRLEAKMVALGGRPHWGKLNFTTRSVIERNKLWPVSSNLNAFLDVKAKYDPQNLLGNAYLDAALGERKKKDRARF